MPIPDYQTLILPLLRFAVDGNDHTTREAVEILATEFKLTSAERNELLASGQQAIFNNRVGWASVYLKKAELKNRGLSPILLLFCYSESCVTKQWATWNGSGKAAGEGCWEEETSQRDKGVEEDQFHE